jgi:hypothetical protein
MSPGTLEPSGALPVAMANGIVFAASEGDACGGRTLARGGRSPRLRSRSSPALYLRSSAPEKPRPASRDPFPKRPCTERTDAPRPARRPIEAYPLRYGEGGQRSRRGCSGTRMPGSYGNGPLDAGAPGPRLPAEQAAGGG